MALLQHRLNLKVAQKQILTPGLVQMVSLLALNKQELKEMIDAEILENPVLEQLEDSDPQDDLPAAEETASASEDKPGESDPFDDIDFGSYFQDYLDPGYRTPHSSEISEKPSFENFLSKPTTLADHLMWQLGSLHLAPGVREAAELVIGNLNDDGYLTASDDELLAALASERKSTAPLPLKAGPPTRRPGFDADGTNGFRANPGGPLRRDFDSVPVASTNSDSESTHSAKLDGANSAWNGHSSLREFHVEDGFQNSTGSLAHLDPRPASGSESGSISDPFHGTAADSAPLPDSPPEATVYPPIWKSDLREAIEIVRKLDPVGIAARDLRECLLIQLDVHMEETPGLRGIPLAASAAPSEIGSASHDPSAHEPSAHDTSGHGPSAQDPIARPKADLDDAGAVLTLAHRIIDEFLPHLLKRDLRELSKLTGSPQPRVQRAIDAIRALDPRPGQRYNREEPRLIEPDVAFVKRDDEYVILINDEEVPMLRLNRGYRRMMTQEGAEREVRDYVKERYRSAIQLMRNIEQRRNTILRTCETIVRRQQEFLEEGVDALKPMMIKEVAEEIGVHASTVSRAVANKYVHTPQGVFELRYFFSEGVNGPEGADTPLPLLKRKVKKMIESEDPHKPLTDDSIAHLLQSQGIKVNRRTIAKYREDMGIPSTHQRRVRI